MIEINNINEDWQVGTTNQGDDWSYRDLSGERLGVRIEELSPGEASSEHHYHTSEEEHVLVLSGTATLLFGHESHSLTEGQHVWFRAGDEAPHHILNDSDEPFKFLVFGERRDDDVVFYPELELMLVKSLVNKRFTYKPIQD